MDGPLDLLQQEELLEGGLECDTAAMLVQEQRPLAGKRKRCAGRIRFRQEQARQRQRDMEAMVTDL